MMATMTTRTTAAPEPTPSPLLGYESTPGAFDELLDDAGGVRPHWRKFVDRLAGLSPRDRLARSNRLDRQVRETGLVHDIFADPDVDRSQWRLNLVPFIISADEWRWLEQALAQRARLNTALLSDLYGPQSLLRDGTIPAGLVFADPTYLRACQGIEPPGGHLQFCAFDVARGTDGVWRIIDSHAETPAGLGYVVANRIMHDDVCDDIFDDCGTRRISPHFRILQEALIGRLGRADPSIALLTPGPDHDDYFSHAYFARYMGVHLVEGDDLRVMGDEVYLKTLEGLKRVDGIIRCIEAARSDPLELDPGAFDGPVGLLNACRKWPSLAANALGSAVIENRGLGGYLPALCRKLLGEDLMLWDAPRWWLGDPAAREQIEGVLDAMIIRPAREGTGRPGRAQSGRSPAGLSTAGREALRQELAISGASLVAEEPAAFSMMPRYSAKGLERQSVALRLYVGCSKDSFSVLPGGIALAVDPRSAVALSASSGDTHDVWVLADKPEKPHVSLWTSKIETARVDRAQRTLQSRVADNLYWLGRYVERADWTLRVLRSAISHRRLTYFGTTANTQAAQICLQLLLSKGVPPSQAPIEPAGTNQLLNLATALATRRLGDYSLELSFAGIYRVASLTRDRLSLEAWRTVSAFQAGDRWHKHIKGAGVSELQDEIEDKLAALATFGGHMHESMTRNYGWYFLDMGRRLERAYNLCDALAALFAKSQSADSDSERLKFILELADSFITYRSRYRVEPMLPLVLDLLLIDETNPRSLAYQIALLSDHLQALPMANEGTSLPRERRIALELQTAVRLAGVDELSEIGPDGSRTALARLLQQAVTELPNLSDAISRRYFRLIDDTPHRVETHSGPRR
jgi:uncharacterized circularly permuted ATP-grasp superfamily protein/uncharacterized alpha-E superfamily protein